MKFNTPEEMLEELQCCDLYSPEANLYVFLYNELGSICVYDITEEEAQVLSQGEYYWGASLGWGGNIYDSVAYLTDRDGEGDYEDEALGFCQDTYTLNWNVADYKGD